MLIPLIRWIDRYCGDALAFVLGFFARKRFLKKIHPRRILVIRVWTIGESLLALPMIERLHRSFPNASLDVLVTSRSISVMKNHPFIQGLVRLEIKSFLKIFISFHRYDLVIDAEPYFRFSALLAWWLGKKRIGFSHGLRARLYNAHGNYMPNRHVVHSFCNLLKPLGILHRPTRLVPLPYPAEDKQRVIQRLKEIGVYGQVIAMHTGTAESVQERAWPAIHFARLIDLLIEHNPKLTVILGGRGKYDFLRNEAVLKEVKYPERVFDWANQLSFVEFCALMTIVDCFVANDSGPMHVAAAMGAKTVGLFGPEAPYRYGPFPLERNLAFYKNGPIGPCIQPWLGKTLDCTQQVKALHNITPEEVYEAMHAKRFI